MDREIYGVNKMKEQVIEKVKKLMVEEVTNPLNTEDFIKQFNEIKNDLSSMFSPEIQGNLSTWNFDEEGDEYITLYDNEDSLVGIEYSNYIQRTNFQVEKLISER